MKTLSCYVRMYTYNAVHLTDIVNWARKKMVDKSEIGSAGWCEWKQKEKWNFQANKIRIDIKYVDR